MEIGRLIRILDVCSFGSEVYVRNDKLIIRGDGEEVTVKISRLPPVETTTKNERDVKLEAGNTAPHVPFPKVGDTYRRLSTIEPAGEMQRLEILGPTTDSLPGVMVQLYSGSQKLGTANVTFEYLNRCYYLEPAEDRAGYAGRLDQL